MKPQTAGAILLMALSVACLPSSSTASHGGPELAEILGWDPVDRKVFFRTQRHDESGYPGSLFYFALDGPQPTRAIRVGGRQHYDVLAAATRIRPRLVQLKPLVQGLFPRGITVVGRDSVPDGYGTVRYRIRFSFGPGLTTFEATCYGTQVALAGMYPIPGREEIVMVLAFIGNSTEGGYETQVPLLIRSGETGVREVAWQKDLGW